MAWTVIPDSDIDPDSPITTALMTALRDNVGSAMAGDSGAPRSVEESVNEITAGSSYRIKASDHHDVVTGITNAAYEDAGLFLVVPRSGDYQVTFDIQGALATTANGRIYKNASPSYTGAVAVGTERTRTDATWTTYTETLTSNAGDILTLYGKITTPSTVNFRNFRLDSAVKQHG